MSGYSTWLQRFMTETCILLFFSMLASKSQQLLITDYATDTNRIQREFLFNNCIQSQNLFSASKLSRQKTNFPKPRRVKSPLSTSELESAVGKGRGWGFCAKTKKDKRNHLSLRFYAEMLTR
jgi:hypothetical protein